MSILFIVLAILPLLGYILSKVYGRVPKGLIDRSQVSKNIAENATWQLPLTVIGILFSFIYNFIICGVFFVSEVVNFVTNLLILIVKFLYKWIKFSILWLYNNVISPTIIFLLKNIYHYFILTPFKILLIVINSVAASIKWNGFKSVLIPAVIGSIAAAVLYFVGHLLEAEIVGIVGVVVCMVLTLSWIVASIVFNTKSASIKTIKFIGVVLGVLIGIFIVLHTTNRLDATISYGGFFAGLLHSPTVLGLSIILIVALGILFFTNIGVMYINTTNETNVTTNIKEFVLESIKRFWLFLLQPLFVGLIALVILFIPFSILKSASSASADAIVNPHLSDKTSSLAKEYKLYFTSDESLYDLQKMSEKQFKLELDSLKEECAISHDQVENTIYKAYLAKVADLIAIPTPIMSADALEADEKAAKELLSKTEAELKQNNKDFKQTLKDLALETEEIKKNMPEYYSQADLDRQLKSIADTKKVKARIDAVYAIIITDLTEQVENVEGRGFRYGLAFLFYLISKAVIYSFLIALLFRLYAYTVKPVYDYYQHNYLVNTFEQERSKNVNQPWLGWFIILLVTGGLTFFSSSLEKLWPSDLFNSFNTETKVDSVKKDLSAESNENNSADLSENNTYGESTSVEDDTYFNEQESSDYDESDYENTDTDYNSDADYDY